ncbi:MAG: SdiA-regulated domain-containing protein [Bacteroidales bacterium]
MKFCLLILVFFLFIVNDYSQETLMTRGLGNYGGNCNCRQLEMVESYPVKQLIKEKTVRFDLSGLLLYNGNILAIADKEWDRFIYKITENENGFDYLPFFSFCTKINLDIEGIDYCNNIFYLIDEFNNCVYQIINGTCELKEFELPWEKYGIDRTGWGNRGFEGIAIDSVNKIMYLAKEREPRRIFSINMQTLEISEPFIPQLDTGGGHDIAELKFENGYLYILERGLGQITRIDVKTKEKVAVSYQAYVYKNGMRWFKNDTPQFGMAEAFVFIGDEIWLGIDNNGNQVSEFGKTFGLQDGSNTAIIVFKRPEGF